MKNKIIRLSTISLIIAIMALSIMPNICYAAVTTPTSLLIDGDGYAFQNVLEDDDQLYIFNYSVEYALAADAPSWMGEVYLASITDGTTAYKSIQPWGYFGATADSLSWWTAIYLTAAEVTSLGLTWNDPTTNIQIGGNPSLTWSAGVPVFATTSINYSTATTSAETQSELETRLRIIANYYETISGGTLDLAESVSGVVKLTETGEIYFTYTMPIVRYAAPNIFANTITGATFEHQEILNDYYVTAATGSVSVYGVNWVAQTFTPDISYEISGVQLKVLRVGNPGTFTVSLRATLAGVPTGADLVSGTKGGNDFSTYSTGEWESIAFTADYALTAGTVYAIVVRATTGDANNYVNWRGTEGAGDFADGQRCNSANSGVAWAASATWDMQFSVLSKEGVTAAMAEAQAARLKDSPFDVTDVANDTGISTMWMSSLIWLAASFCLMIAALKVSKDGRIMLPVFIMMTPVGYLAGFLHWQIAAFVALVCTVMILYNTLYKSSTP